MEGNLISIGFRKRLLRIFIWLNFCLGLVFAGLGVFVFFIVFKTEDASLKNELYAAFTMAGTIFLIMATFIVNGILLRSFSESQNFEGGNKTEKNIWT